MANITTASKREKSISSHKFTNVTSSPMPSSPSFHMRACIFTPLLYVKDPIESMNAYFIILCLTTVIFDFTEFTHLFYHLMEKAFQSSPQ